MSAAGWTVRATGPRALVQDLGRPGLAHLGVGRSGAADRRAHRLGQRLLRNDETAASIEVTFGGFEAEVGADVLVAVTGAPAVVTVDGAPVGYAAPVRVAAGSVLAVGVPERGLRTYVSVRGGFAVDPVLGSRATDLLSGVGPPPLAEGDVLPIGAAPTDFPDLDVAPVPAPPDDVVLRVAPGPRLDWLADPGELWTEWTVSGRSDRVGLRLEGRTLRRAAERERDELPSEGVVRGSIQVPPGGEPVLFLADHPVTGGYPVAGVVLDADTDLAAQARPGQRVRLVRA